MCSLLLYRALVGMMMYNPETKEVAKPSELMNSIKAIMSVLQSIENYGKLFVIIIIIIIIIAEYLVPHLQQAGPKRPYSVTRGKEKLKLILKRSFYNTFYR